MYRQNTKLVATIVLDQASDYGLAVVQKTKTTDNPSGFVWKSIEAMKKKNKSSNATAEIALDNDLDDIKFTLVKKYYNDDIDVTVRYNMPVSETDLI